MDKVRVRFAPSPTGFFHIGNAKTALYNWLVARHTGGTCILRLEDTDVERSKSEYADVLLDCLSWLGLDWDEGPAFQHIPEKGDYGPYRQSQRMHLYQREAKRLLDEGKAYKCFCTKEELDAERARAAAEKRPPRYSGKCRALTPDQVSEKGDAPFVIRFRVPEGETVVEDIIQGTVRTQNKEFDDFVIVKPNGAPIFHLAVVVDDGLMEITHVIRGDDHLTNTTRHVMLFKALGYPVPKFAHMPLVHDEQGQRYSKRKHGANVLDWRKDGYLAETLINYLALLGWTPEDGQELLTREDLVEKFTLERASSSASRFDLKKVQWLNGQHIRRLSVEDLRDRVIPRMHEAGLDTSGKSQEWLTQITAICQEKIKTLNEIVPYTDFFFSDPTQYEEKAAKKHWTKPDALKIMAEALEAMEQAPLWTSEALHKEYEGLVQRTGNSLGRYVHPTRLALTGKSVGPGLFELAELLGKENSLARMRRAIEYVSTLKPDVEETS